VSISRDAVGVRLLVTAFFVALGWAYLHPVVKNRESERPSSSFVSYELSARHDAPSDGGALDIRGSASNQKGLEGGRDRQPVQRGSVRQSAENQSGRRQVLAVLAAMLIQIQSAGTGGK
jgi:hypothetical protein